MREHGDHILFGLSPSQQVSYWLDSNTDITIKVVRLVPLIEDISHNLWRRGVNNSR